MCRNIALRVSIWSVEMMSFEWAKHVATGLLVIRLSRPFAAKSAANWVMKREVFYMALANCRHMFRPYFGPHQYSVNQRKAHVASSRSVRAERRCKKQSWYFILDRWRRVVVKGTRFLHESRVTTVVFQKATVPYASKKVSKANVQALSETTFINS